jgi:hypothetical protein
MKKAIDFISAVARKILSMRGKGIASIANRSDAEAKAGEIAAIFQQSGLPMNRLDEFIKSEKDVTKYLNLIEESAKSKVKQSIQPKPLMKSQNPADVFDLKGNRIKNTDNIMGGEEIKIKDPALYEDRGGNIIPAQFKNETDEQIKKRLMDQNKKSLDSMKKKLDEPDDMASGGRAGYSVGSMVSQARQDSEGIESRLEQLGGDVTSAEQLLQQINQRLESAGSSAPESGGSGIGSLPNNQFNVDPMSGPLQPALQQPTNATMGESVKQMPIGQPGLGGILGPTIPYNFQPATSVAPGTQPMLGGIPQKSFDQMNPTEKLKAAQGRNMQQDVKPGPLQDYLNEVIKTKGETNMLYPNLPDRTSALPGSLQPAESYQSGMQSPLQTASSQQNLKNALPGLFAKGGRAGLYQGGQAQIEPDLSNIGHGSDALMARNRLLTPGSQATTSTGLSYLLGEDNDTTRVPYKEKGSVTLADLIKVNASGNKSGKNQIMGAPDGITANTETFNAIIKMDIPIMEKINLLGSYGYGKDRFKVEKDNKELFLGEDGYKDRNIGLGFNQNGEGLSGSVIRNLETGDNDYQLKFLKSFAEGGRAGYNEGNMVVPKPKPMDEYLLNQVISPAGIRTLAPETRQMLIEELKEKIRNKRAAEEKKYQFEELRDQGAEDMYYNNREKELDIKYNPQNYPPSMRKFAGGGVAGLLGEGPRSMVQEPRTNYKEAGVVDKIGGMVNYKNVPYYVNSAAKGATNIAEWMGRLPFAATELASDMIKKPLFKAGDEIPGLPGVGAKFVGGEMFKKFGDNLETGALAEKLGLSSLVEEGGKNLTPEARTVGGLLELGGEFANIGGILAAGKNLFKGGDSLKKLSQSMGKVKDNKTLEKLVDETLTARGEGRRDFNKLVASGGLMVALQSIGLGGIKAAKTKSAPDAVLTLKTLIDDSDVMTDSGPMAVGRPGSLIDVSGLTDAVKKSLAVIMKNRKNTFGDKVVRNKVKGKGGKFTDDYEDISTEDAAYIMEELQKRGHNVKLEHYDDMGGQGVDDLLDKFKNKDGIYGKDNYDKFSKKVAKMTDKEKLAYHTSITDDSGNYYDEFVEELLDMNFKNNPK